VPAHIVGRIIGKSGKNVRELQRNTGATIKLPEDAALLQQQGQEGSESARDSIDEQTEATETPVVEGEQSATVAATPVPPMPETAPAEAAEVAAVDAAAGEGETKTEAEAGAMAAQAQQLNAAGFVVVRIFGTFQASQLAQRRIQALVVQSVRGYNPMDNQMVMAHRNSLNNITNHQVGY
jgi:hypothetical protein